MSSLYKMKTIFYFFLLGQALFFLSACETPRGPAEMYAWRPPSADELKLRRFRQKDLDAIAVDIDNLLRDSEEMTQPIDVLRASIQDFDRDLAETETRLAAKIRAGTDAQNRVFSELAEDKAALDKDEKAIRGIRQARVNRKLSVDKYLAAIQSFKNGKYDASAAGFKKSLALNPPPDMVDKIRFGIGTSLYKLKKYPEAAKDLEVVVGKYPKSGKWFASSLLLGWIYIDAGETSKALYALDEALKKNPPQDVKNAMERLVNLIRQGESDVGS